MISTIFDSKMSTLGSDQHVLVTGANGFVASHILALLLDVG